MALGTSCADVVGGVEFSFVDPQRDRTTIFLRGQLGIGVASQTVLIGETGGVEDPSDLVRRVTVDTGGYLLRFLFPQPAFDDLPMHLLDLAVALRTGCAHIFMVDARTGIGVRQDVVRGVTRGADRRHGQALFEQTLPVNAHRVICQNSVLWDVPVEGDG